MKLKFNVYDNGTSYQIVSINQNELDYDTCTTYETFSWNVYETIASALIEGKNVSIPKDLSKQIDITDIIIEDNINALQTAKNIVTLQIKDLIYNQKINKICLMDTYNFNVLNNWFIDKGIIITNENRDEKYLEIINIASEIPDVNLANQYIENIETLLVSKDKIDDTYQYYKILNEYFDKIETAQTEEELTAIYNTALNEYK